MGEEAYDAALSSSSGAAPIGVVGAGTGATAGGLKGAVGSASVVLADGTTVAALVVVNAFGSCVDPLTGELYAARFGLPGEFTALLLPDADEVAAARAAADAVAVPGRARYALATTIGVVATDAILTKAQCAKVSGIAHDGMARAIRPVHTMFDGDTVFTLATGTAARRIRWHSTRCWMPPATASPARSAGRCWRRRASRPRPAGGGPTGTPFLQRSRLPLQWQFRATRQPMEPDPMNDHMFLPELPHRVADRRRLGGCTAVSGDPFPLRRIRGGHLAVG